MFCYNPSMSIWHKLLAMIGLRPISAPRKYQVSESMHVTLTTLSQHEGRPEDELIQDLLAAGLTQYYSFVELWHKWEALSPRERDVAALVCLGYTNKEIGVQLSISPETVKTHLRNVLVKFGLQNRTELRLSMKTWDFSAWQK
ncbi:MAG: LuxR family transcriptional regulator [Chloroflexi bacterium]|nr:LuxR family transcriptional regulator [Chloroflexota bacterium]